MNYSVQTSIVFIIFNRPDTTEIVFEQIRKVRPKKLFLIADGPRKNRENEEYECMEAREIVQNVDWECEVFVDFSAENLGCKRRISSGLKWVFSQVDEAIILEDDCLPNSSFFQFCDELLDKYRDDSRVMMISGDNFLLDRKRMEYDYYFSRHNHIWGWATWKRSWSYFDENMSLWPTMQKEGLLYDILNYDQKLVDYWIEVFQNVYENKLNSWAHAWTLACWIQNGLTILPSKNLISNIGFSNNATHTHHKTWYSSLPTKSMMFPLEHPPIVIRDAIADEFTKQRFLGLKDSSSIYESKLYQSFLLGKIDSIDFTQIMTKEIGDVVIFGTMELAQNLFDSLVKKNVEVKAFIDNQKEIESFSERPVVTEEEFINNKNLHNVEAIIISIEGYHDDLFKDRLISKVPNHIRIFTWRELNLMYYNKSEQ